MKLNSVLLPVVVIGGGFSGTLAAIQLVRRLPGCPVILIEEAAEAGPGLAYGHASGSNVLNVRAGDMSAFDHEPDDFRQFAAKRLNREVRADEFLPRALYGDYLKWRLGRALESSPQLTVRRGKVMDVVSCDESTQARVLLKDGEEIAASRVVLAAGNQDSAFAASVWADQAVSARDARALEGIGLDDPVIIIGTGLTMIDAVCELDRRGHRGPIHLASRHGLLPQPYAPASGRAVDELSHLPDSNLRKSVRVFRRAIAAHEAAGGNWRDVFKALRPVTPGLWQELSPRDRGRFLRFISPYWEIHRHQASPESRARVDRLIDEGRVILHRGTIVSVEKQEGRKVVALAARANGQPLRTIQAEWILDATGPARAISTIRQPLIGSLLRRGYLVEDEHRLGAQTLPDYRAVQRNGLPSHWLHVVGPMLRARYFEATAVPELRLHTAALAARLATELSGRERPPAPVRERAVA